MPPSNDRNLLFGLLAFQMELVPRETFLAAMKSWVADKSRPLADILISHGSLSEPQRAQLEQAVEDHLAVHGQDANESLAALGAATTLHNDLANLADGDLCATLARISTHRATLANTLPFPTVAPAGSQAGRYRVLREHARGGLGKVQVALDEELQREVALKEIQGRFSGDISLRRRFLLEAEITGRLEHPGVVPVYGLGSYDDGRPYYAMRFIKGESLRTAIERFHAADNDASRDPGERALSLRKLLGRFVSVCNAIEYAHSRGILHRDIKPDNIMLGAYGETLVVDWGLAKLFERDDALRQMGEDSLSPSTAVSAEETQLGQAVGTPAYMSPEQGLGRHDSLTPASDVYSLGATLYSLLTGKPAFISAKLSDVLQQVQDGEFPKPQHLNPRVPSALSAVCLKAMSRQAPDRYASARELADEVEAWLADEPVRAYPEPWSARAGRWLRRHRAVVTGTLATAAAVLIGLVALVLMLAVFNNRLKQERKQTEENFELARQSVDQYLVQVSDDSRLKQQGLEPLRRNLLETAREFYEKLIERNGTDPKLRGEQARAYFRLAGITGEIGSKEKEVEQLQAAIAILGPLTAAEPQTVDYQDLYVKAHNNLGLAFMKLRRDDDAVAAYDEAAKRGVALTAKYSKEALYHSNLANTYSKLGALHLSAGNSDLAKAEFLRSTKVYEFLLENLPWEALYRQELATLWHNLGILHADEGRTAEAEVAFDSALKLLRECAKAEPQDIDLQGALARCVSSRGSLLRKTRRLDEAEQAFLESISIRTPILRTHPDLLELQTAQAVAEGNLGAIYDSADRLAPAEEYLRRSVETYELVLQKEGRTPATLDLLAASLQNLARVYDRMGNAPQSRETLSQALGLREQLAGEHPDISSYQASLAQVLMNQGIEQSKSRRLVEAGRSFDRALIVARRLVGEEPNIVDHRELLARLEQNIGSLHLQTGDLDRAEASLTTAAQIQQQLAAAHADRPQYRHQLGLTRQNMALLYSIRQDKDQSETEYRAAIEIFAALHKQFPRQPEYSTSLGSAHNRLGLMFALTGSLDDAESEYKSGLAVYEKLLEENPDSPSLVSEIANTQNRLGQLYMAGPRVGEAAEAVDAAIEARGKLAEAYPNVPQYRFELCQNLVLSGWLAFQAGNNQLADERYSQARTAARSLLEKQPDSFEGRSLLGQIEHNRGMLFVRVEQFKLAERAFRDAVNLRDSLSRDNPVEPSVASDLTWSCLQLAVVHLGAKELEKALALSDQAAEAAELIAKAETRTPAMLELLQAVHGVKARVLCDSGELEMSLAEWNRAFELVPDTTNAEYLFGRAATFAKLEEYERALADTERVKGPLARSWKDLFERAKDVASVATGIRKDENLSEAKRDSLSKRFDDLALDLLRFGFDSDYLKDASRREQVKKDEAFETLSEREEFGRLLQP